MKTVFTNDMVCHVFCQQSQDAGRNSGHSLSFRGDMLYSYSERIARIVNSLAGSKVMLMAGQSFSITTQQHKRRVWRAWKGETIIVPYLGGNSGYPITPEEHAHNLAHLERMHKETVQRCLRQVSAPWRPYRESFEETRDRAFKYADWFGLEHPAIDIEADLAIIAENRAKREKRQNQPAQVARRHMQEQARAVAEHFRREQQAKRDAQWAIDNAERIEKWKNGEDVGYMYMVHALLRHKDGRIQTCNGAEVPVAHALLAYRLVKRCHEMNTAWIPAVDEKVTLGHFTLDSVDEKGNIKAGCHNIQWEEIHRLAIEMGW